MKTAREGGGAQGAQGRQLGIREGEGNDGMMEWWSDGVGGAQGRELGGRRAQRHRGTKAQRRGMMEWWLEGGGRCKRGFIPEWGEAVSWDRGIKPLLQLTPITLEPAPEAGPLPCSHFSIMITIKIRIKIEGQPVLRCAVRSL